MGETVISGEVERYVEGKGKLTLCPYLTVKMGETV